MSARSRKEVKNGGRESSLPLLFSKDLPLSVMLLFRR